MDSNKFAVWHLATKLHVRVGFSHKILQNHKSRFRMLSCNKLINWYIVYWLNMFYRSWKELLSDIWKNGWNAWWQCLKWVTPRPLHKFMGTVNWCWGRPFQVWSAVTISGRRACMSQTISDDGAADCRRWQQRIEAGATSWLRWQTHATNLSLISAGRAWSSRTGAMPWMWHSERPTERHAHTGACSNTGVHAGGQTNTHTKELKEKWGYLEIGSGTQPQHNTWWRKKQDRSLSVPPCISSLKSCKITKVDSERYRVTS